MGPGRFERPTSPLSGVRSNRLSYGPGSPEGRRRSAADRSGRPRRGRRRPARTSVVRRLCAVFCQEGICRRRPEEGRLAEAQPAKVEDRTNPPPALRALPSDLRKEVIQPQVPLRLPCYDFTPVADPTVDGCLPCGLAHRLRVEPTPMV